MQNDKKEIEILKEQLALLKQIVEVQKELIANLRKFGNPVPLYSHRPFDYPLQPKLPLTPYWQNQFYCNTNNHKPDAE